MGSILVACFLLTHSVHLVPEKNVHLFTLRITLSTSSSAVAERPRDACSTPYRKPAKIAFVS